MALVLSGIKALPEPILTQIYVALWRHKATVRWHPTVQRFDKLNVYENVNQFHINSHAINLACHWQNVGWVWSHVNL